MFEEKLYKKENEKFQEIKEKFLIKFKSKMYFKKKKVLKKIILIKNYWI